MKFIFLFLIANILNASVIDMKKFSGLWYEIARVENLYQNNCVASSVEYILENNKYNVYNRCFESSFDGKLIEYSGKATLKENILSMTYFYFFTKKYKIRYVNNYNTALVTNDDYTNVWIMSRTPYIEKKELNRILKLVKNEVNKSKLVFTKLHPKGVYK